MRKWTIGAAVFLWAFTAHSASVQVGYHVGDEFEIKRDIESKQEAGAGSSGSSTDRDVIMERVVGISQAGPELEYDLTKDTTPEDRARQWQFPARVLKPPHGPLQLLDRRELEVRGAAWLKSAGLTQAACGQWYFTWNAFRIDCDPQSAIDTIEGFDLGPDELIDGASYRDSKALSSTPLKRKASSPDGAVYFVEMAVDPDAVRRDQADSDVVVATIMRKPLTREAALNARATEDVAGTIAITFETDPVGHVWRQTKVTKLHIKAREGQIETRTTTETLERRLVSQRTN